MKENKEVKNWEKRKGRIKTKKNKTIRKEDNKKRKKKRKRKTGRDIWIKNLGKIWKLKKEWKKD